MLSLNSGPSPTATLLVDVFSDNSAPPAAEVSEENFHRYGGTGTLNSPSSTVSVDDRVYEAAFRKVRSSSAGSSARTTA